uniref:ubiquitinyl hydrolase 1 n=1 Tax=Petromyzon marinus TaxID=7757 RepID=A0AAJ7T2M1_PETMA|nr:ubiquitin carboxyl-terminal hydrolase 15-like isoform X1 [Petromyzon marinus]
MATGARGVTSDGESMTTPTPPPPLVLLLLPPPVATSTTMTARDEEGPGCEMAEGGAADLATQKGDIGALLKTPLKKGDTWYLVDCHWFKQWKKHVGFDSWEVYSAADQSTYPGPIDNSGLFKVGPDENLEGLKDNLIDELDYILVPTEAWRKLVEWYGYTADQEPVERKVIEYGMFVKHCKVEVYLTELRLCDNSNLDTVVNWQFSKADTIDTIEKEMRKLFHIPEEKETRLWNKYMTNTYEPLNKPEKTLQDVGLFQGQVLVIEQKNEDGTWPRQSPTTKSDSADATENDTPSPKPSSSPSVPTPSIPPPPPPQTTSALTARFSSARVSSSSSSNNYNSSYNSYSGRGGTSTPGLCGLSNLGNTCFMNSALQCLSNTPPLTTYFLEDAYLKELNRDNPLGMRGEIACAYADLIKQMWSGSYSSTVPRSFKTQVGRFAPQFSGYQQQDSQELLAFLLDGLHEDLNRIRKKPYVELKDAEGRDDKVVAQEAWDNHRKRNDSIIVDIFHGLFKSTLICPDCAKVSVTFDPFCYLTLPLPIKTERAVEVTLVWQDPKSKPTMYRVVVPKMGSVSDLCAALGLLADVPKENMVVTDVYNHRFHKIFTMNEPLNGINDRDDIFVFEVADEDTAPDHVHVAVYMRERKTSRSGYSSSCASTSLFGLPLLVSVPRSTTTLEGLYEHLTQCMERHIRKPDDEEEDHGHQEQNGTHYPHNYKCNGSEHMEDDTSNQDVPSSTVTGDPEQELASESESDADQQIVPSRPKDSTRAVPTYTAVSTVDGDSDTEASPERGERGDGEGCADESQLGGKGQRCGHKRRPLFSIHPVNSYGNTENHAITDDGKPIKFQARTYLALEWDSETRARFYNNNVDKEFEKHDSMLAQPLKKKNPVKLKECIELFTTKEELAATDPWYCPNCKKHKQATKKFDLWALPKVLVVHLKRFSYNKYWRDKLDTLVDFPIRDLDMSEFVIGTQDVPCTYDLIAVSNHYGGMGGGHYTAYAKNKGENSWYYFDDSSVSSSAEDQIVSKAAYVLFYQRRDNLKRALEVSASLGVPEENHDSQDNRHVTSGEEDAMDNMDNMDTN